MTEPDRFDERLTRDMAAIADSRMSTIDPYSIVDAVLAAHPPTLRRWGRLVAAALFTTIAIAFGLTFASLSPKPPAASVRPVPSPVELGWVRADGDPGIGHDPELNQWMGGVVAGGPGFVAWGLDEKRLPEGIGASMAIWVSQDGSTWHEVTYEPGETLSHRFGIQDIAAGPRGIVATGDVCCHEVEPNFYSSTPTRWFSSDGEQWTRLPTVGLQPDPERNLALVAGPDGFVEVGAANEQPAVWFSPDGHIWAAIPLAVHGYRSGVVSDITTDSQGYLAVGSVSNDDDAIAVVWRSTNGLDWVRLGADDAVLSAGPVYSLERVVSYPGGLFAIGGRMLPVERQTCYPLPSGAFPHRPDCVTSERVHLTSPDGDHWSEVPISPLVEGDLGDYPARVLTGDDSGLLVIAPAYEPDTQWPIHSLWTSSDGRQWIRAIEIPTLKPEDLVNAFVVVGDRIVAVGQNNAGNAAAVWIGTRHDVSVSPSATEAP
jgi:hypothetical protein